MDPEVVPVSDQLEYHAHTYKGVAVLVHRHDGDRGPHGHPRVVSTCAGVSTGEPGESTPLDDLGVPASSVTVTLRATWPLWMDW